MRSQLACNSAARAPGGHDLIDTQSQSWMNPPPSTLKRLSEFSFSTRILPRSPTGASVDPDPKSKWENDVNRLELAHAACVSMILEQSEDAEEEYTEEEHAAIAYGGLQFAAFEAIAGSATQVTHATYSERGSSVRVKYDRPGRRLRGAAQSMFFGVKPHHLIAWLLHDGYNTTHSRQCPTVYQRYKTAAVNAHHTVVYSEIKIPWCATFNLDVMIRTLSHKDWRTWPTHFSYTFLFPLLFVPFRR